MVGLLQDKGEEYEQAQSAYKEALRTDFQSWNIHFRLAVDYLRLDKFREAEKELKYILKIRPFDEEARYLLALVYSSLTKDKKAIQEFNTLLQRPLLEIDESELRYSLLRLYVKNNYLDKALEQCRLILKKDADDSLASFYVGYIYTEQKKTEEAIEAFVTAIERNSYNSLALNSLSYLYAEQGIKLDEAKELVEKALEIEPSNGAYLDTLGWVYFKKGQNDEALRYLNNASVFMEDAEIFDHIGDVYYDKGEFQEAKKNWEKALKLDRKRISVKNKLTNLRRELGKKRR